MQDADWKALDEAVEYLRRYFRRRGLPVFQLKEKYGTMRCYCVLQWNSLETLLLGFGKSCPEWLQPLSAASWDAWWWAPVKALSIPYLRLLYRAGYSKVINKWPRLRRQICCCADYHELLEEL